MLNKKKIYIILFSLIVLICLSGFIWSFVVTKDIRNSQKTEKGAEKNQVVSVKNLVLTETKDEENQCWDSAARKRLIEKTKTENGSNGTDTRIRGKEYYSTINGVIYTIYLKS